MTLEEKRAVLMRAAEAGYFTEALGRNLVLAAREACAPAASALLGEEVEPDDLTAERGKRFGSLDFWGAIFRLADRLRTPGAF